MKGPLLWGMSALLSPRLAAAVSAVTGAGLIGLSAIGIVSLDGQLRDAESRVAPSRLIEELGPCPHAEDRLCERRLRGPLREI